ncbi:hypothetical protein N8793_08440, partial [Pseudomonadales bacterium]|nr:hypothetical protein [Pseudomonadales bacterium]
GTDASGNVLKVLDGGGTVTGSGTATQVAFWDGTTSLSGNSNLYWDSTNDHLGIGDNTPTARLFVSDTTSSNTSTVQINHTRDDADKATRAIGIDMNLSGADTTTADRTNYGLFIDIDSSANGDASNEHRIYGVSSTVNFTGFTDIARGGFFNAESNYTGGKTSQLIGVHGQATHDAGDVAGGVSNMYGVYGFSTIQDLGDVDNAFGGYFLVAITDARGAANVGVTKAVEGEILIDKSTAIDYGTMIGISSIIDNNEGAVPNFGNQFLFKGDYQGDKGSDAYGIYCEGDKHYLEGKLAINLTTPTQVLHVAGNARVTGAYYDSNNSPGTANQVLISTVTGTDWVDGSGSSIIGGPYLPLAGGTMTGTNGVLMPDNFKLKFGDATTPDLEIYHDGGNSFINDTGTGALLLKSNGSGVYIKTIAGDTQAQFLNDGAVNLYYDNSFKFATTSTGVAVTGDIQIDSALLSNQENTDVDTGTETVANVAIATYTAAFFDFVIKKTTNVRSGTVYACHDGTNVEFTETSTQDLGDTSDVTLSVDISGGNMRLLATVTSDDWSVKSLIRAI